MTNLTYNCEKSGKFDLSLCRKLVKVITIEATPHSKCKKFISTKQQFKALKLTQRSSTFPFSQRVLKHNVSSLD